MYLFEIIAITDLIIVTDQMMSLNWEGVRHSCPGQHSQVDFLVAPPVFITQKRIKIFQHEVVYMLIQLLSRPTSEL